MYNINDMMYMHVMYIAFHNILFYNSHCNTYMVKTAHLSKINYLQLWNYLHQHLCFCI